MRQVKPVHHRGVTRWCSRAALVLAVVGLCVVVLWVGVARTLLSASRSPSATTPATRAGRGSLGNPPTVSAQQRHPLSSTGIPSATALLDALPSPIKLFLYDLPARFNDDVAPPPHQPGRTSISTNIHMIAGEVGFHRHFQNSRFRTFNSADANLFYVPVYPVAACTKFKMERCKRRRGPHCTGCGVGRELYVEALDFVRANWPAEHRARRHAVALLYDFGACMETFANKAAQTGIPPALDDVSAVTFVGQPPCYRSGKDVVVPPFLDPTWADRLSRIASQAPRTRPVLAFFAGNSKTSKTSTKSGPHARGALFARLKRPGRPAPRGFHLVDSSKTKLPQAEYAAAMANATFCLIPRGHGTWTYRLSEAVLLGCMPVFVNDRTMGSVVQPFEAWLDYSLFSITVDLDNIEALPGRLAALSSDTLLRMSAALADASRWFSYTHGDAYDATLLALASLSTAHRR